MRILVLAPILRHIALDRLQDAAPDYKITVNTISDEPNVIAVLDAAHESSVPPRWPDKVVVLGDTLTGFNADIRLPLAQGQQLLESYLAMEVVEDEEESQDVSKI
jgi:hypothetical protein